MSESTNLITTKLSHSSTVEPALARDQLVQKLCNNVEKRLSLICAGAGYGKTELVSAFAHQFSHPVIWYTVDQYDADELVFATHLLAGLTRVYPHIDWDFPSIQEKPFSRQQVVSRLITNLQEFSHPVVVILDNFDEIKDDSQTLQFVELLLSHAPAQLHLIITSRKMPCLGQLSRLRSRDEAIVFSNDVLAFSAEEIRGLYTLLSGADLPLAIAQQIEAYTAGWPLSVHLALKSIGQRQGHLNAHEVSQQLAEYVKAEILTQQPDRVRRFLQETAIFKQFTPALAAEGVLGYEDAPALIAYLQRHNLFLKTALSDDIEIHSYPQQIRELLQQNQMIEDRDRSIALHQRAARYFEERGQLQEALDHYQHAENKDAALNLVESLAEEMLNSQQIEKLRGWLQCITPSSQGTHPKFLLYQARLQARIGQPRQALLLLGEARRLLSQVHNPRYEMAMLALMGLLYVQQGDFATAGRLLQQARQGTAKDTALSADFNLLASSLTGVAENVPAALETCQKALYQYEIQADLYGQIQAMIDLAGLSIDLAQLTKAGTLIAQSAELVKQLGTPAYLASLHATMTARRLWLAGDFDRAQEILEKHVETGQDASISSLFSVRLLHIQGVVYRDQGDWDKAKRCLETALDIAAEEHAWALKPDIIEDLAWLTFGQGDLETAWALAQQAQTLLIADNIRQEALVRTLLGALARERGQHQDALFYLESAQEVYRALDFKLGLWSNQLHLIQTYLDLGYEQQALQTMAEALACARTNKIAGSYFWSPDLVARLCLMAIANDIEVPFATWLASKLADHLTVDDVVGLKALKNPQISLTCIHLLKAIGTAEAQRQLQVFASGAPSSQVKEQAERAVAHLDDQTSGRDLPEIRICSLGALKVECNGQLIEGETWAGKSKAGRQKVKTLLAYLVERGSQGATKDELIEALWGSKAWGRDEARLESSLARTLSALRQVLEPDLVPPATSSFILNEEGRYYLNTSLCWIDVVEFQRLIREARNAKLQGDHSVAQAAYQEALALYRGEYLRDIPTAEEWAGLQRYALSQNLGVALMSMGSYYLEQGLTKDALVCYQDAIKHEPTNHTAHYKLIDALRQEGRLEDAVMAYQHCYKIFIQEVDAEPPETITELHKSIQAQLVRHQRKSNGAVRRNTARMSAIA